MPMFVVSLSCPVRFEPDHATPAQFNPTWTLLVSDEPPTEEFLFRILPTIERHGVLFLHRLGVLARGRAEGRPWG